MTKLPLIQELEKIGDAHEGVITVATHSGQFHADELVAIAILKEALPNYHLSIIRTRKFEEINAADIAIDVGGGRFDHHNSIVSYPNKVPMASCGKILAAVEPCQQMINILNQMSLYAVQAIDNGARVTLPRACMTSLFDWVASFNPTFEERTPTDGEYYDRFFEALEIVLKIYRRMRANASAQMHAENVLRKAPTHLKGRFIELPRGGIPWFRYAYDHESILGVIHQSVDDGTWKVTTAPIAPGSQERRVSFPSSWGGLEGQALEIVSKINGMIFCHLGLHLAGFKTKESALAAARLLTNIHIIEQHDGVL